MNELKTVQMARLLANEANNTNDNNNENYEFGRENENLCVC